MAVNGIGINHGDEYYTPKWFVELFGKFDYDPATNALKANEFGIDNYDTIETNGLSSDWGVYSRIWCNPPFTDKYSFIKKAIETYNKTGADIYILIPLGCLTTKKFYDTGFIGEIYIPNKRIAFESPGGKVGKSPSTGSIVIKPSKHNIFKYMAV